MAEAFFERENSHPRGFVLDVHLSEIAASGNVFGIHHDAVFHFIEREPRRIHAAVVIRERVMHVGASSRCHLERILERLHRIFVIAKLFIDLGVDEKIATEDACRIEHYISDETFDAIKEHIKRFKKD